MACKSIQISSSSRMTWKHDVFVSFRGDTRNGFTDHLFGALQRNSIVAFRDDTKLKRGEPVWSELQQAIEVSRVFIVVFSRNYASSTWCLRELVKIFDCVTKSGKHVLPVFYDVDPSEVRKQSGKYGEAFAEHEETFKEDLQMVQSWRLALTKAANLSGWDIRDKPQYVEIEKIVQETLNILGHMFSTLPNELVGWQSPVEELEKLLHLDSRDEVQVVGICGMGGIGKTTLASVLYNRIWRQFDARFFIDDVNKLHRDCCPHGAQKQLLCQSLNEEKLHICNPSKADDLIRSRLGHARALMIVDNVNQVEQVEQLVGYRQWLGAGSRIIIISRNEHLLGVPEIDKIYNVQLLDRNNSLKLFCTKAFRSHDIKSGYEKLAYDVLYYADGLPLAIKVLGAFLFGSPVHEWKSALARLRKNPEKDIMDVLRISYDGLKDMEKEIFLHIACFFPYGPEKYLKEILDICGLYPDIGIRVLIEKSLITRVGGMMINMHNLLRELGKSIVRKKAPKKPRKWSRLWDYEDFNKVMLDNMVAENLEAIVLEPFPDKIREWTMRADALSKMSQLRLLMIYNVNFSGCLNHLSNELRLLRWDNYPFTCLPPSFQPDKLVKLILPNSSIKQLWEGTMPLHNLSYMDLSHSKNLMKTPDFSDMTNLERLKLEGCIKLERIDPSIGLLRKLILLDLKDCENLVSIPKILDLCSLEVLNLSGCSKLLNNQLLNQTRNAKLLKMFDTSEPAIHPKSAFAICKMIMLLIHILCAKRHGDSVGSLLPCLPSFQYLYAKLLKMFDTSEPAIHPKSAFSICKMIMQLIHIFCAKRHGDSVGSLLPCLPSFQYLYDLDLSFCNLLQIPYAIGGLHGLEKLNLAGNNFVRLPSSIKELSTLTHLNLQHCMQLEYLPQLPSSFVLPVRRPGRSEFISLWYQEGLYIFNCPKLVEMECCNIMAFSWIKRSLQAPGRSSYGFPIVDVVIPGNQIPWWFKNQIEGSSISMDSSAIMHDNNWIGVAFCVAFSTHLDPTNLGNEGVPKFVQLGGGFLGKENSGTYNQVVFNIDLVTVESDHLWLLCYPKQYCTPLLNPETADTFIVQTDICHPPPGLHIEVKRCGFRCVFPQDLEQLNATMMRSGSSSGIQIDSTASLAISLS